MIHIHVLYIHIFFNLVLHVVMGNGLTTDVTPNGELFVNEWPPLINSTIPRIRPHPRTLQRRLSKRISTPHLCKLLTCRSQHPKLHPQMGCLDVKTIYYTTTRGKSLLESWVTTFLPDWQPHLIFVRFISNFLCMCSNSVDSAHVILK